MSTFGRVLLGLIGVVLLAFGGLVAFYASTADEGGGMVALGALAVAFVGLLLCSAAFALQSNKK